MRIGMYEIGLLVQIAILGYVYIEGKNGMRDVYALKADTGKEAMRVTDLAHTIEKLKHDIDDWDAHPFYKEKIARESLHMARRGDIVYYR